MNAPGNAIETAIADDGFDFEAFFRVHYERVARAVVRVVRDPARAEEIAHSPNHLEERNAIAQASEYLLIIKTEKLKWPPIEMK